MPRKQKLKVYRTPIGFHDAYVAAPSQKAALRAWGADVDLFSRGVAEVVDDERLSEAPLESPGSVIRVARGTTDEHVAALPADAPRRMRQTSAPDDDGPSSRRRIPKRQGAARSDGGSKDASTKAEASHAAAKTRTRSKPRPSRARLDEAEQALERGRSDLEHEIADLRQQEKVLQQKRRDLEERRDDEVAKLEASLDKARFAYGAALEKWRS